MPKTGPDRDRPTLRERAPAEESLREKLQGCGIKIELFELLKKKEGNREIKRERKDWTAVNSREMERKGVVEKCGRKESNRLGRERLQEEVGKIDLKSVDTELGLPRQKKGWMELEQL